ncbi:MAG: DNA repair protein RadA [Rhodospirillaceae bacterium]|nr:DNA repair protein RadA [Rhodospirillaceae bacterium]MCA8933026.1 DNA repair protein RadA [Rhodospirillaceae bacterium]
MAKPTTRYVCQACGASYARWTGQCTACGAWNDIIEESLTPVAAKGRKRGGLTTVSLAAQMPDQPRRPTGMAEFDRVVGGGLVPGSAILIAGDPGIGKSTLLLQVACRMAAEHGCLYVSGEEAAEQVQMRAQRLGLGDAPVELAASTSADDLASAISGNRRVKLVIVDSIQTMATELLDSAPGTVTQVRGSAAALIRAAKDSGVALVLVGHVTKDGAIAGPRVLEHMVDTVLSFEGERSHHFRILRTVKNRFGPADEIGVFQMSDRGLEEVDNPSSLFLAGRTEDVPGACIFAGLEGTRPVLVEIQALVAPSALATPRRAVVGWDSARLSMILAVLEARCGVPIGPRDVYLNVAGGLRIQEPAADLAVAVAILSSLSGTPVSADTVVFGEIGLSGEVRAVGRADLRLREARKLGLTRAICPAPREDQRSVAAGLRKDMNLREIARVAALLPLYFDADTDVDVTTVRSRGF